MEKKYPHDHKACRCRGVSRRQFFTTVGVGAVTMAVAGTAASPKSDTVASDPGAMNKINLRINDHSHRLLVEPRWSLLYVMRERLGLTGAKEGCGRGECGACTVLIDDIPHYACLMLAVEAEGKRITTLEGLLQGEELGPVQQAFWEQDAYQCGYCTPGQIMAVEGLLRAVPEPTPEQIRTSVSGNLCRCGAYPNIFKAAGRAAELKRTS